LSLFITSLMISST